MRLKFLNQLDFSSLLFDTVFGLILFYSFDSLVGIKRLPVFIFFVFSMLILIHWWLMFKSSDDTFKEEVTDSAADIVFGVVDAIILYYLVQYSQGSDYRLAVMFLIGLFAADLVWALAWRYVGRWRTADAAKIKEMEHELNKTIILDILFGVSYIVLYTFHTAAADLPFIAIYVLLYILYIVFTFRFKILDMDIF